LNTFDIGHNIIDLDPPRPLKMAERELLTFCVNQAFIGSEEIRVQAKTALVSGECQQCPGIYLSVDKTLAQATVITRVPVKLLTHENDVQLFTEVNLHIVNGFIDELEIWSVQTGLKDFPPPSSFDRVLIDDVGLSPTE
jgi:hypothetical protein